MTTGWSVSSSIHSSPGAAARPIVTSPMRSASAAYCVHPSAPARTYVDGPYSRWISEATLARSWRVLPQCASRSFIPGSRGSVSSSSMSGAYGRSTFMRPETTSSSWRVGSGADTDEDDDDANCVGCGASAAADTVAAGAGGDGLRACKDAMGGFGGDGGVDMAGAGLELEVEGG